jgi:hypothetical protein
VAHPSPESYVRTWGERGRGEFAHMSDAVGPKDILSLFFCVEREEAATTSEA